MIVTTPVSQLPWSDGVGVVSDDSSASGHSDNEDIVITTATTKSDVQTPAVARPFPWKLHEMLHYVEKEGLQHVVSWMPHGRAFRVHKPKEFAENIMPLFFGQTKYPSFQRQLNLYGFSRFSHGRDKGAYYNACMIRGDAEAVRGMVRRKIKGTSRARRSSISPTDEPDFYNTTHYSQQQRHHNHHSPSEMMMGMINDDDILDTIPVSSIVDESMYEPVDPSIFDSCFDNEQEHELLPSPFAIAMDDEESVAPSLPIDAMTLFS